MEFITQLIEERDFCALGLAIVLLFVVGKAMTEHHPGPRMWGLRLTAVVFAGVTAVRIINGGISSSADFLWSVIAGLETAGLFLGPAWIVLAMLGFVFGYWKRFQARVRARAEVRRHRREEKARLRAQEQRARETNRSSPQREQEFRDVETRRRAEALAKVQAAQRREDARLACEVLYHLRAAHIGDRFSHDQLADFFKKYMGEDKSVELVERRAGELQQLIQQHFEAVNPPEKFTTLADLTAWYEEQHKQIDSLPASGLYKDHFLVRLNERYSELSERLMERI